MHAVNFARRQQYRRLRHAISCATLAALSVVIVVTALAAGQLAVTAGLLIIAAGCGLRVRCWVRLAQRSRVGARSGDEVPRAGTVLERERWRVHHSLRWAGPADLDSVAIAPTAIAL